jgi:hypothetical protein
MKCEGCGTRLSDEHAPWCKFVDVEAVSERPARTELECEECGAAVGEHHALWCTLGHASLQAESIALRRLLSESAAEVTRLRAALSHATRQTRIDPVAGATWPPTDTAARLAASCKVLGHAWADAGPEYVQTESGFLRCPWCEQVRDARWCTQFDDNLKGERPGYDDYAAQVAGLAQDVAELEAERAVNACPESRELCDRHCAPGQCVARDERRGDAQTPWAGYPRPSE